MKAFLFISLLGYAVNCDDTSYYVVQMPDRTPTKDFNVYWNVPTMQCTSKKVPFEDLFAKYGIIQNAADSFRGNEIAILYDPGEFPALLKNTSSGEIKFRNKGVPQEGDLIKHLNSFKEFMDESIPDKNFSGIGIIDFESWKPIFRQNFGSLTPYKTVSIDIERKRHWFWPRDWIEAEASRRFEESGREFMQATLALAKRMRPQASWGYYGYPYCYNMASNNMKESCADKVPQENDRIKWLWRESTALYPSVYSSKDMSSDNLVKLIRGRVREASREREGKVPILPYFWYRYRDGGFFKQADLDAAFNTFYKSNASGVIIWGSSNDVNTVDKCQNLMDYITNVFGPTVAKYTKRNKYNDEPIDNNDIDNTTNVNDDVSNQTNSTKDEAEESILIDLILHEIVNYCVNGCYHRNNNTKGSDNINLSTENPFKKTPVNLQTTIEPTPESTSYNENNYLDNENLTTEHTNNLKRYDYFESTASSTNIFEETKSTLDDINTSPTTTTEVFKEISTETTWNTPETTIPTTTLNINANTQNTFQVYTDKTSTPESNFEGNLDSFKIDSSTESATIKEISTRIHDATEFNTEKYNINNDTVLNISKEEFKKENTDSDRDRFLYVGNTTSDIDSSTEISTINTEHYDNKNRVSNEMNSTNAPSTMLDNQVVVF